MRQFAARRLKRRVQHLPAQKTAAQLAARADALTRRQRLLLRGVETEKPQGAGVRAVVHRHQQLTARPQRDLTGRHRGLDLNHVAVPRRTQAGDPGFVLVAQWQVQRQVNVPAQSELEQGFLWASQRLGWAGWRHGSRHFGIVSHWRAARHERRCWQLSTAGCALGVIVAGASGLEIDHAALQLGLGHKGHDGLVQRVHLIDLQGLEAGKFGA